MNDYGSTLVFVDVISFTIICSVVHKAGGINVDNSKAAASLNCPSRIECPFFYKFCSATTKDAKNDIDGSTVNIKPSSSVTLPVLKC